MTSSLEEKESKQSVHERNYRRQTRRKTESTKMVMPRFKKSSAMRVDKETTREEESDDLPVQPKVHRPPGLPVPLSPEK